MLRDQADKIIRGLLRAFDGQANASQLFLHGGDHVDFLNISFAYEDGTYSYAMLFLKGEGEIKRHLIDDVG